MPRDHPQEWLEIHIDILAEEGLLNSLAAELAADLLAGDSQDAVQAALDERIALLDHQDVVGFPQDDRHRPGAEPRGSWRRIHKRVTNRAAAVGACVHAAAADRAAARGERGVLRISPGDMLRIRWNPFYSYLEGRVLEFVGLEAD